TVTRPHASPVAYVQFAADCLWIIPRGKNPYVVIKHPGRPAMVRTTVGVRFLGYAIVTHVGACREGMHDKIMPPLARTAVLKQRELATEGKRVSASAGNLRYRIKARTILHRYPFAGFVNINTTVAKMD